MSQDKIKIVKFKQELPPQWFVLLIGPDIFSVTTWIPTTDFNTATSPSPIIMIIVHPSSGLSFYVDGSLKLMWVETDGWKKAESFRLLCLQKFFSLPQLKSGGGVSNKQNITDFLCSDFYVDRPTVNVDISHCSGWSQSWHIKLYRPSVWKLCLNLNSISV